jgi:hypothetical protein
VRLLWLHIRNSPIRWALPVLIALDLALLLLRNRYWIGVWPETGAAAQVPALLLGALGAGAAAWAAGAPSRQRLEEQLAAARAHPAAREAYRLAATVVILLVPYLVGHAVAFGITARTWPPGWHLWLGYLALGLVTMLLAAAWGWVLGKLLGSIFAAMVAVLGWLVLLVRVADSAGVTLTAVSGPPMRAVDPAVVLLWLGLGVTLLATLPWLPARDQLREQAWALAAPAAAALALVGVLIATTVVVERASPGENAICVDGRTSLCVWPEHRKYVPLLRDVNGRIDTLPDNLVIPPRMSESGIDDLTAGERVPWFFIVEGSPWSYAGSIRSNITGATWAGCDGAAVTDLDHHRFWVIDAWLETYLAGGGSPDYFTSAPPAMQESWADGRAIANERPVAEQLQWVEREVRDLHEHYCQPVG